MSKRLYLTLFLGLTILLFGYYLAYLLTDFWATRICQIASILLSGFFIIGFNYKALPKKKHDISVRLSLVVPIIIGICGLIILNHFIPYMLYNFLDWEWQDTIQPKEENPVRFIFLLVVWVFLEEIYFRRVIAQKIFNAKGFSKALWISALIFSISHWFSTDGLLYIFLGGLALGYVYLQTRSVWMSILAHLTYNLLIFYISPKITEQISNFNSTLSVLGFMVLGFLMLLIMVFLLKYLTKDEILKEKPVANNTYSK